MKNKLILNYVFIIGILVLLLNDHILKDQFGNWFTGKLSDFAGLVVFPLFLKYVFSFSGRKAVLLTVVGFVFWKSPISQPFIDGVNSLSNYKINRVVDYTDFIAFISIPFTTYVLNNIDGFRIKIGNNRRLATNTITLVAIFSFIATSQDDEGFLDTQNEYFVINSSTHEISLSRYKGGNLDSTLAARPIVNQIHPNDTLFFGGPSSPFYAISSLDSAIIIYDDSISISYLSNQDRQDSSRSFLDIINWEGGLINDLYYSYKFTITDGDYEVAKRLQ